MELTLLRNALHGNSRARTFYTGIMRLYSQGKIGQYPTSYFHGVKEYVTMNNFYYINIYLTININNI